MCGLLCVYVSVFVCGLLCDCVVCVWCVCMCVWSMTEEEISNMRRELDKYGIQMPAFSKIGGMLASEVRVILNL